MAAPKRTSRPPAAARSLADHLRADEHVSYVVQHTLSSYHTVSGRRGSATKKTLERENTLPAFTEKTGSRLVQGPPARGAWERGPCFRRRARLPQRSHPITCLRRGPAPSGPLPGAPAQPEPCLASQLVEGSGPRHLRWALPPPQGVARD